MKKGKLVLLLIFLLLFSALTTYVILEIMNDDEVDNYTDVEDFENYEVENSEEDIWRSPLSGKETTKELSKKRPVAVMFDNHPRARWQSGLTDAEIVYEFPVENPYTRYIGLFLLNSPDSIGPIRSTRPYLVHTVASYDPLYVRCGGSEDGKREVSRLDIADIDCLDSQAFTRSSAKKAPNNLYISMTNIEKEQKRLGYGDYANYEGYIFNKEDTDVSGMNGETINIKYNNSNTTKYEYDSGEKVYKRFKDGELHIDESDKSTIKAKNIIIQETKSKIIDDVGRKEIDVVGSGKGMYITNGKVINISWIKPSARKKTVYYDENNEEIQLNEGTTWIQVVQSDTTVDIE